MTEFPAGNGFTYDIAAGPDGNLWFTTWAWTDGVGRISPSGVWTKFSTGFTAGIYTLGITASPDGNLWVTEGYNGSKVGRITPAGVATEFSAGITPGSHPFGITAGPDGTLWFTERAGRIGRITPAGVVTELSAGITPGSDPVQIAVGSDGNLWFTESIGKIGRVSGIMPAAHFAVSAPDSATVGTAFSFTVAALDQFGNTATGYVGTVHFSASDGAAVLPSNSTLTSGAGTFTATLRTAGNQTITATDTVNASITGTSNNIANTVPISVAIPTTTEWWMVIMSVLLGGSGVYLLGRRRIG